MSDPEQKLPTDAAGTAPRRPSSVKWKEMRLTGWGRTTIARVSACRPERRLAIASAVAERPSGGLIACGAGRSYGDASLNSEGHVVLTERLDRILALDVANAEMVCEPGAMMSDLQRVLVPKGLSLPAIPGTGFATIGGALANDVHGKNHDLQGSFGDHVKWFDLLLASGEVVRVSAESDPELFAATVGGLGLTGIAVAVCFGLLRVPSNAVMVIEMQARNLDHFFDLFANYRETASYSVGWIDALSRGQSFGRGILEIADPSEVSLPPARQKSRSIPFDFPGFVLNRWTVAAFNAAYYRRIPSVGRTRRVLFETFLHPLDAIRHWNRMYGRRGFHQFQCVIPEDSSRRAVGRLLEVVSESGAASFLAVLKTLGREGRGYLSFPMRGYTLALDIPARSGAETLFRRLEAITLDHGGRIYLAKDSLLSPDGFARMYPRLGEFRSVLERVDPDGVFRSDIAKRLRIRG